LIHLFSFMLASLFLFILSGFSAASPVGVLKTGQTIGQGTFFQPGLAFLCFIALT
jgi:hypothetical protein